VNESPVLPGIEDAALILIASYGRAGSSRLMELIKLTNTAAVAGPFPYECRSLQFGALCATGAGELASDGTLRFNYFDYQTISRRLDAESAEEYRRRFHLEMTYLAPYALESGRLPTTAIAEKSAGLKIVDHVLDCYRPAAGVFLDRDPRDVFISILEFNEKRKSVSFGAEDGPIRLAERIADFYLEAADLVRRNPLRVRVVSYRQLIGEPLAAVESAVGVPVDTEMTAGVDLSRITNAQHLTAANPAASLDRWRTVRNTWREPFAILERAYDEFGELLDP